MFDWIFAFIHLIVLLGVLVYAGYSLVIGRPLRTAVIIALMALYYFIVLHKPVKTEIERKRGSRKK